MQDLILVPAGLLVGLVNAVAGGGSLLSFPLFLLLGYSPLVANVSNSIGVFPSNVGGVVGYRNTLRKYRRTALLLCSGVGAGTLVGIALLLTNGEAVFESVVPWMMIAGALLMLAQPALVKRLSHLHPDSHLRIALVAAFLVGIYGGYFGPGVGVMLLAVFGAFVGKGMQETNALKNIAVTGNNILCVVLFALFADVAWAAAGLMAIGTLVGGFAGTRIATRLPDKFFRISVVVIGLVAAVGVAVT